MKLVIGILAGMISLSAGPIAQAGPFGLDMGTPLSKLHVIKHLDGDVYSIVVPNPNSEFESYSAVVTAGEGLCKILAIGKDHDGDASGADIQSTFNSFDATLAQKYGSRKNFDFLKSGSIWTDDSDYAMALLKKDRVLSNFWDKDQGSTLPADVKDINLDANASGPSSTYITLAYELSNFDQCISHRDKADQNAL